MTFRNYPTYVQSTSAPPSPILGDEWYNTGTNKLYKFGFYNGVAQWQDWASLIGSISGGSLSGTSATNTALSNAILTAYTETVVSLGNVNGPASINLLTSNYFTATSIGATTWTFDNPTSGSVVLSFILKLINGGAYTQIWPTNVKWPGAVAPTLTVSGNDTLAFVSDDNGATWRGALMLLDSR
jgi:hypothetical protein